MDPKSIKPLERNYYTRYGTDSWIESEYSHFKFSDREWNKIHREFYGYTNRRIHMPEIELKSLSLQHGKFMDEGASVYFG